MVAKRQATQGARAGKRAKLDPVSAKVKEVLDALSREDCELMEPATYREGILAAVPLAIGLGAAKDERHAYQEQVAQIVFETLKATEEKFEKSLAAAKDELSAAQSSQAAKETSLTRAQGALEEQKKMAQEAQDALTVSQEALMQATTNLKEISKAVDNFDIVQQGKEQEHAELSSAFESVFEKLKTGTWEDAMEKKSVLSQLSLVLKKFDVDQSLRSAAPSAMSKNPADRGDFDNMVVDQIQESLKARVESLAADVSNGETLKSAKVTEQTEAQETLDTSTATVEANKAAVVSAEEKIVELEATLTQAKVDLKEQSKIVGDVDVKTFYEQSHLENFKEALQALEFLRERTSTPPEGEALMELEKVAAMDASVAMGEANLVA